jgi:DNA-binding XRE family transcriptional regulator
VFIKICRILVRGLGAEGTPKIGEMQDIQMQLGRKIRELRKKKGWSQEEFADKCGIGRAHMSLIERGQQNLTLATLWTITRQLEVSMSYILNGIE